MDSVFWKDSLYAATGKRAAGLLLWMVGAAC